MPQYSNGFILSLPSWIKDPPSWGRYDTEIYGGKCGYIKDITMRGRVTVFLSGKMISTGADGVSQSLKQLNQDPSFSSVHSNVVRLPSLIL